MHSKLKPNVTGEGEAYRSRTGSRGLRVSKGAKKRPQPAPPGCGLSTSATAEWPRFSASGDNHYIIVMFSKKDLRTTFRRRRNERINVKTIRTVLAAMVGVGLALSAPAQGTGQPGEKVNMKSLPAPVQQTINRQTAGGEIVRVKREDDANGRWNYEVIVRTNGKDSSFEVDPNGKLIKKHSGIKK